MNDNQSIANLEDIDETKRTILMKRKPSLNEIQGIAILGDAYETQKPSLNEKQHIAILEDTYEIHDPSLK